MMLWTTESGSSSNCNDEESLRGGALSYENGYPRGSSNSSIQVVSLDAHVRDSSKPALESTSLLQHRHPNDTAVSVSHSTVLNETAELADSPSSRSTSTPPSPTSLWEKYVGLVERRPLITKSITATILFTIADLCAQGLEHVRRSNSDNSTASATTIDWIRALRFAAFGLVGAPWSHYYFYWLDYCLPPVPKNPCSWTTLVKVVIDQFIQAPLLLAIMICALSIMKGEGWDGMKHDLSDSFVNALLANWKLWIPASLINIAFVKPSLRVLYVNLVFFLWTIILSLMLNGSESDGSSSDGSKRRA